MAMVDIPSTYGALLLGGLIAAGYVPFIQFGQYALCDGRFKNEDYRARSLYKPLYISNSTRWIGPTQRRW